MIESEKTPGGCWAHFAQVLAGGDGYRALTVGQAVPFAYETAEQDGYAFRAVWVGSFASGELRRPDAETAAVIARGLTGVHQHADDHLRRPPARRRPGRPGRVRPSG